MRTVAVEFRAAHQVAPTMIEIPEPRAGEALVRALYSGISSGTEMLAYRGELDPTLARDESLEALSGTFTFPFRYGYSLVGVVESSRCELEEGSTVFCFHPHQGHIVRPCTDLLPINGIDPRLATMFPLVETALQISLDAGQLTDLPVVVMGLGTVGILTGAMLSRMGVIALGSDPRPWRRAAAGLFGIPTCPPDELEERVSEITSGEGIPVAIEASGNPEVPAGALELLAHEGTLLIASWYGSAPVSLPLGGAFHRRRLAIKSTQVSTIPANLADRWTLDRRRKTALSLTRELPLKHLATHEFHVQDAAVAYEAVDNPPDGLIHAAIFYEGR